MSKVDNQFLHLRDTRGIFFLDKVHEANLKTISKHIDKPWNNHFLLAVITYADINADVVTIKNFMEIINPRFNDIFNVFHLHKMIEFDVETHMYQYFKVTVFQEHSNSKRSEFLIRYRTVSYKTKKWITSKLNSEQQAYFEQYIFPMPSYDSRDFSFTKSAKEQAQNTRKSETDVIVPLLPQIRAEGQFRWNQLNRLRQAFLKACEQAKTANCDLPLEFHYDEPERVGERFYFRLWDKPSFVLNHQEHYPASMFKAAYKRTGTYSSKKNHYFIEFVKAERLVDDEEAEGL